MPKAESIKASTVASAEVVKAKPAETEAEAMAALEAEIAREEAAKSSRAAAPGGGKTVCVKVVLGSRHRDPNTGVVYERNAQAQAEMNGWLEDQIKAGIFAVLN